MYKLRRQKAGKINNLEVLMNANDNTKIIVNKPGKVKIINILEEIEKALIKRNRSYFGRVEMECTVFF